MTYHFKFNEVATLVKEGIPTLLTGEKGSGKTTLAMNVTEHLGLRFFSMSMTRQTTLSHLIGFMSVNGEYIPSLLRDAVENGGVMLLDEIDAADTNVLLSLNTIENGYVSFPTGIVKCHPDFRLMATANPQDQHHHYTGRVKLDGAILDRFDIINVDRDADLEKSLVDTETYQHISLLRELLKEHNSSTIVSMRDSLRYQKRKELKLLNGFIDRIIGNNPLIAKAYLERSSSLPKHSSITQCDMWDDLVEFLEAERKNG